MAKQQQDQMRLVEEDDGSFTVSEGEENHANTDATDEDNEEEQNSDTAETTSESDDDGDEQEDAAPKKGGHEDEETAEDEDAVAAKRARRKQERIDKKTRQREEVATLRSELAIRDEMINDMANRLNAVEARGTQTDIVQLDATITQTRQAENYYKNVIADAVKKQDGVAAAEATQKMLACVNRIQQLEAIKTQATNAATQRGATTLNPAVRMNGEAWLKRNKWYNPQSVDADAQMVRNIDAQLMSEGINPALPGYWTELDRRLEKYGLRKTTNSGYNARQQDSSSAGKRSGASSGSSNAAADTTGGSGRSSRAAGSTSSGTYKLSAQRVQALKEAGMWNDPKVRADAIREFRDYDRKNGK